VAKAAAAVKPLKSIALDQVEVPVKLAFDRVREWAQQFRSIPWLDGVVVGPVQTVGAGDVSIEHKLGRVPQGFIVIGYEGATADTYPSMVSKDARFMVMNFGGSTLATLWVWG
jgi:hypothetical protein